MTERIDCAVIGAGVVGLAVARALALAGREVVVLESEDAFGTGVSARNSEVIHAGMYYPAGSLKARLCVRGNALLRRYCADHGVEHRMVGKLIVATDDDERAVLSSILGKGQVNGVEGLTLVSGEQAREMEPDLNCIAALFSPVTGIVDTHQLMLSLLGEAEANGASLALNSPVTGGHLADDGVDLWVGGAEPMRLSCRTVINSAGLEAPTIAASIQGVEAAKLPRRFLCKGNYFSVAGRQPFQRLVYPVPVHAGLGVHYTLDLGGQGRFGPDTQWIDRVDYAVDPKRANEFYAAIRRYWPGLPDNSLAPAYAGIRPKITSPDEPAADFRIEWTAPGLIGLYGIESPGLTSCLAIADLVAEMAG